MGSWGNAAERRADRMPRMYVQQAIESQAQRQVDVEDIVKSAMMDDLGLLRVEELPLDNTRSRHHIPQRPRRAPVITERSEALNGYLALAETGMDDSEAMAVRDLNDLGGPSAYRPSGGPVRELVESRRPVESAYRGMQTSKNGILLPPGAEVRQFNPVKTTPEGSVATVTTKVTTMTAKAARVAPHAIKGSEKNTDSDPESGSQNAAKHLPPHLRKKAIEAQSLIDTEESASGNAVKPAKDKASVMAKAKSHVHVSSPEEGSSADGKTFRDRLIWSGPCKTMIPGKTAEVHEVLVELRLINSEEYPNGLALFVLSHEKLPSKRHRLEGFAVSFHKNQHCIVNFSSPDARYNLMFSSIEDAKVFAERAAMLQQVTKYLSDMAVIIVDKENTSPSIKAQVTEEKPAKEESVSLEPVASDMVPQPEANTAEGDSSKRITGIADAFGKLSLDMIKESSMYKSNRSEMSARVQYTPEELFDKRSAAEAPAGIHDVKIPLQRDQGVMLPPHLHHSRQRGSTSSLQAIRSEAKLHQDWLSGALSIQTNTTQAHTSQPPKEEVAAAASEPSTAEHPAPADDHNNPVKAADQAAAQTYAKTTTSEAVTTEKDAEPDLVTFDDAAAGSTASADSAVVFEPPFIAQNNTIVREDAVKANITNAQPEVMNAADQPEETKPKAHAAVEQYEQTAPAMPPVFHANPLFGHHGQPAHNIQGMPPQMSPNQMIQPQVMYAPHLHGQQAIPGMQMPPGGVLHAVSVTYHISHPDSSAQPNASSAPNLYHFSNQQAGTFSPSAQSFQPQQQAAPQSSGSRMRRGLESSIFATGYSGAKFAGSFTGDASPQ